MDLPQIPLLSLLNQRMSWLQARQDLLSQNVANADTPGYVAQDLRPEDFESLLKKTDGGGAFQTNLLTTNSRHIDITPSSPESYTDMPTPDVESNPNGNSVSLEAEMIKVSDTQAQFQAATNLYAKAVSLMRTALGK